ncbi:MAG: arginine--tRNA ligase, partial [Pseudomonadota bacterium]
GLDGKPYKTRDGGVVKLAALLDEAEERATTLVQDKNPDLSAAEAQALGSRIGIGAIKYAELSKNRTSDYIFDMAQMITFDGNTAPYLQYAYTRIMSMFDKGGVDAASLPLTVAPVDEEERRLAVAMAGFNDVLEQVAAEGYPHYLCGYLYEVATRFTTFYEACPILKADEEHIRARRLALAGQAASTLRAGLGLLGIDVVERM